MKPHCYLLTLSSLDALKKRQKQYLETGGTACEMDRCVLDEKSTQPPSIHPGYLAILATRLTVPIAMTIISEESGFLTFINVFTVSPENQQRLIDLLTQATDLSVRHAQGFVSSALHRSLDGIKVTIYAQWQSMEAYQAMRGYPDAAPI